MAIVTKQQKRAEFALEEVKKLMTDSNFVEKELAKLIVRMPTRLLSNGLGQMLAFLRSKEENEVKVFKIIKKYLGEEKQSDIDFLLSINTMESKLYQEKQMEVLKMLEWLKYYGRAFAEKK